MQRVRRRATLFSRARASTGAPSAHIGGTAAHSAATAFSRAGLYLRPPQRKRRYNGAKPDARLGASSARAAGALRKGERRALRGARTRARPGKQAASPQAERGAAGYYHIAPPPPQRAPARKKIRRANGFFYSKAARSALAWPCYKKNASNRQPLPRRALRENGCPPRLLIARTAAERRAAAQAAMTAGAEGESKRICGGLTTLKAPRP